MSINAGGDSVPCTPARGFAPSTPYRGSIGTPYKQGSRRTEGAPRRGASSLLYRYRPLTTMGLRRFPKGDRKALWSRRSAKPLQNKEPVWSETLLQTGSFMMQGYASAEAAGGFAIAPCTPSQPLLVWNYKDSHSLSHAALWASEGIFQSPRGERATEPIFTPSGEQLRLNCWVKKRR